MENLHLLSVQAVESLTGFGFRHAAALKGGTEERQSEFISTPEQNVLRV